MARLLLRRQHRRRRRRQPRSPASTCCACSTSRPRPLVGVAINVAVALIAYVLAGRTTYEADAVTPSAACTAARHRAVYVAIALSGMTALGRRGDLDAPALAAFRRHGLHLLADPRRVPARARHRQHDRRDARARRRVAAARARLVPAAAVRRDGVGRLRAHRVAAVLADQPVHRDDAVVHAAARSGPLLVGRAARARCCGARAFRSRSPAVATTEQDAARLAGGVYAANTVGAIVGSLATSFVLIPWIGSSHAEQVLIIVSALSALLMLEPSFAGRRRRRPGRAAVKSRLERRRHDRRSRSRWSRPGCSRAASTRCRACWSPTAAMRRRASARPTSSTSAKG